MKFLSDKKYMYFTGVYLSLFAFMICSAVDWSIGIALFKVLAILLFGLFLFRGNSADDKASRTADFEKSVMVLVVLLFNIFMLLRGKMQGYYEVFNIVCGVLLIVMGIAYFVFYHNGISVRKWVSENKFVLLVILCFSLLSIEVINHWFIWDAWEYYISLLNVVKNFDADFSGIYGLYLCGHTSVGYSLWLILFQLFKEGTVSVQIADIVLAGVSIFAYYQILRKLLGKKYFDKVLALAATPYAFSPFVMGLVGNLSLDSAVMYFVVIFIACSLYHYECLELIFAFLFCFTKEPAVIYYIVYIIVKIICEYFSENRFHLWKLLKFGFCNIKNYLYALPAVLWMVLYKLRQSTGTGGWGSESAATWNNEGWNCFGIRQDFILAKLKQIFYLNFNWLFLISIIVGIIILCVRRLKTKGEYGRILIPIGAIGVSVIVFNCVYITYMLPRYIVPVIPAIYLIAVVVIGNIKNKLFQAWNILLSVLVIMQCFCSIDPVMGKVFPSLQIGDKKYQVLYETGDQQRFVDNITYNRQNMYWSDTIVKVLNESGYNGDMLIVRDDSLYNVLGHWWILWDTQKEKLEYYNKIDVPRNCVWVDSCTVAETETKFESVKGNRILYIIPEWRGINEGFISESMRASKNIIKQGEIEYKGFKVRYIVMDIIYQFPLEDGNYTVSPKQNSSLGLCTDGYEQSLYLTESAEPLKLSATKTKYMLIFENCQAALDVHYGRVDENGTIWGYEINNTDAQKWILEEVDGYYMIRWGAYALTYDLDNNSVKLTPKTGSDNQLWSFNDNALVTGEE